MYAKMPQGDSRMNVTSFVQLDDTLAFNPGYITRVRFGTGSVATIFFVDGTSLTLINKQLTKFLDWWDNQAIVMTNVSPAPEAPEM
jgi:hypothetical protein